MQERIKHNARDAINKSQREYYLREQLRAIQKELGDDADNEMEELKKKLENPALSEEAVNEAKRQMRRLERTSPDSLEATVIRNHLEWLLNLPWGKTTTDNLNIIHAKNILDRDHYGLEKIKDRILDYLSVKSFQTSDHSPILCFSGPPGVGKTSLGKSIAECLGREFFRISVGGLHDESELKGHRRTYVGALPGRFIQAISKTGSMNPVIVIDEIDKIGQSGKGDPSAALLEILDPEQNNNFYDNYLGTHFDLSKVMFITTSNDLHNIPGPLRDRMEIIELSGYTTEEKVKIAKHHLAPRAINFSGLKEKGLELSDDVLRELILSYTRESGVRSLNRYIQTLCSKFARSMLETNSPVVFTKENLAEFLGPRKISLDKNITRNRIGVTNGLAWTPFGGCVLQVEAVLMPGNGKLTLTGQLGEVMRESAQAAVSYIRSRADVLGIKKNLFSETDLHIHFPAGAVPKDGPSAGITLVSSILSVMTQRPINGNFAMTGEVDLHGGVLPIGGLKEKILAAKQHGVTNVIAPKENKQDLDGLDDILQGITLHFVSHVDEVVSRVLMDAEAVRA
jgi:ATP-dependent Lon protease